MLSGADASVSHCHIKLFYYDFSLFYFGERSNIFHSVLQCKIFFKKPFLEREGSKSYSCSHVLITWWQQSECTVLQAFHISSNAHRALMDL